MEKLFILLFAVITFQLAAAQTKNIDSTLAVRKVQKDSTLLAAMHADSVRIEKEFADKEKMDRMEAKVIYPLFKAGDASGIIPVAEITEAPDPNIDYKILFEITGNNPDSIIREINYGLAEISRVINLHIAAGIPAKKIIPVIVAHAGVLQALKNNEAFQKKYKIDNPNVKIIDDLKKFGAKFIVCGQAMAFLDVKKEELLPDMKVSLTAQTVLTQYQLKGYILKQVW